MMEERIIRAASRIGTPMALAGLALCVLYLTYRSVLSLQIFPVLSEPRAFQLLKTIIDYVFILGLSTLVIGTGAFLCSKVLLRGRRHSVGQIHAGIGDNVAGDKVVRSGVNPQSETRGVGKIEAAKASNSNQER